MKSATKFILTKAFWTKEKPDGLKKSDKKFEGAIEGYLAAVGALGKPSPAALKTFLDAEGALKSAAQDVISEAEKLAAGLKKDKKKKEPYDNTVSALKKPLAKILADNRKTYESAAASLDGAGDPFGSAEAHALYLKGELAKTRRRQLNFALAMQSNAPAEMRICFHPSKGGRALVGAIKKSVTVKKFTFGAAVSEAVMDGAGEALADDDPKAKTLVLDIQGKMIPSLAKRVRVMLRKLGISTYNRVKLLQNGVELESADDTTPDALDELDMSTPDPELAQIAAVAVSDGDETPDVPVRAGAAAGPRRRRPRRPLTAVEIARKKQQIAASRLPKADRTALLAEIGNDGAKLTDAARAVRSLARARVPPERMLAMIKLKWTNIAAYTQLLAIARRARGGPRAASQAVMTALARRNARLQGRVTRWAERSSDYAERGRVAKAGLKTKRKALSTAAAGLKAAKLRLRAAIAEHRRAAAAARPLAADHAPKARAAREAWLELKRYQKRLPDRWWETASLAQKNMRYRLQMRWTRLAALAERSAERYRPARLRAEAARAAYKRARTALVTARSGYRTARLAVQRQTRKVQILERRGRAALRRFLRVSDRSDTAQDKLNAARQAVDRKRQLFDALADGVLSAEGLRPPLPKEKIAVFLAQYRRDPALGQEALRLLKVAKDPAGVVDAMAAIIELKAQGFKAADGTAPAMLSPARGASGAAMASVMASGALRLAAQHGAAVIDKLKAYYRAGGFKRADSAAFPDHPGGDRKKLAVARAKAVAASMLDASGKLDLGGDGSDAAKARKAAVQDTIDDLMFHPSALTRPMPALVAHVRKTVALFATSDKAAAAKAKIDAVTAPAGATSKALVRQTLGITDARATPTDAQARMAVLSAMLTPVQQGSVGSCYAAGPLRALRESDPLKVLDGIAGLVKTGTFRPATPGGVPVPAIKPGAITPGDHPLLKSFEYSMAAAAANLKDSEERKALDTALLKPSEPGATSLAKLKSLVGEAWSKVWWENFKRQKSYSEQLKEKLRSEIRLTFNARKTGVVTSSDGSSTHGVYQFVTKSGKVLDTKASFIDAIERIVKDVFKSAPGTDAHKARKIAEIVRSQPFIDNILQSYRNPASKGSVIAPWALQAGGYGTQAHRVLTGRAATPQPKIVKQHKRGEAIGARSMKLLKGIIAQAGATGALPVTTDGTDAAHVFNLLPNHPELKALASGDLDANLQARLLGPGAALAAAALPLATTRALYERILSKVVGAFRSPAVGKISAALRRQPRAALSPKDLARHISTELTAFRTAYVTHKIARWKLKRSRKGTLTSEALVTAQVTKVRETLDLGIRKIVSAELAARLPLPTVTVADTNWGSGAQHTYFVMAVDPADGQLKLWRKSEPGGRLELAPRFMRASWQPIK